MILHILNTSLLFEDTDYIDVRYSIIDYIDVRYIIID